MLAVSIGIVAPIFALVAIGYGASRLKLVGAESGAGLSEFVFVLAIPALLFRTVAGADFPNVDPTGYWLSYFGALGICWALGSFAARKMGRSQKEAAVIGFASAQSNTVLVGIPLILRIYGEAGSIPLILLIVVHLPITMTIVAVLIARGEKGSGAGLTLLRSLTTHPILLAILAGVLWRFTGLALPEAVRTILKYLGDAAAPCALVAMGLSMNKISLQGSRLLIGIVATLKLLVHPALVYVLAIYVFKLPPVWTGVALLFACCPTGINAYLVADRHKAGQTIASGAIALSTLFAIFTTTIVVAYVLASKG